MVAAHAWNMQIALLEARNVSVREQLTGEDRALAELESQLANLESRCVEAFLEWRRVDLRPTGEAEQRTLLMEASRAADDALVVLRRMRRGDGVASSAAR